MLFGEKILDYWDDILKDLGEIVAIPSVCGTKEGIYPYGENPAKAVDAAMKMAESYGLRTKNVGYYACHAEIGEGTDNAVVMAHLDVVPAGEGWNTPPYEMVIQDNLAFGRGVADNKGAAIVALHCLRAIQDAGIQGKRKLRVIMGSGEEIGMDDMEHYFASEQVPTMGFTPDAGYGICNCEKGILHFTVSGKNDGSVLKSFKAGTVVNAVPYKAEAEVICSESEFALLAEAAYKLTGKFIVTSTDFGAHILSQGIASHGSAPERGVNAASHLIDLLHSVFGTKIGTVLSFAQRKIGLATDGAPIGVACSDEPSGSLTFNLGLVEADSAHTEFSVDIRYPATLSGEAIVVTIKTAVSDASLVFSNCTHQSPLYLPADSALIALLSGAYEDITHEKCEIFSMGGGTYARQMGGKGVAFGASFKGTESNEHNCNEKINLTEFKLHAQICLEAMYRMYTAEV